MLFLPALLAACSGDPDTAAVAPAATEAPLPAPAATAIDQAPAEAAPPDPMTASGGNAVRPQIFDTSQSIRTLMNFDIQANADVLWRAVRYVVTADGVTEDTSPRTDADWLRLRDSALALVAAGNALLLTDRVVDAAYPRDDYPDYTYTPPEIRALIDANTDTWRYYIQQMQATTNATLEAINTRDLLGLLETGAAINNACNGCHAEFWYRPPR